MNREPFDQDKFNKALDAMVVAQVGILSLDYQPNSSDQQTAQAVMDDVWANVTYNRQVDLLIGDDLQASLRDDVSIISHIAESMHYIRNKEATKPENPLTLWLITYLERVEKMWSNRGANAALVEAAQNTMSLQSEEE